MARHTENEPLATSRAVKLYIRPCHASAWDWATREAEETDRSLSEFISGLLSREADKAAKAEMEYRGE
jgi:hypothetical protein